MTLQFFGGFMVVWLPLAITTIVHLAGRKTDNPRLAIAWGVVAALFPPLGLIFILALLLKDDR